MRGRAVDRDDAIALHATMRAESAYPEARSTAPVHHPATHSPCLISHAAIHRCELCPWNLRRLRCARSADAELLHAAAQRARGEAESAGGAGLALDPPIALLENLEDVLALRLVQAQV